MQSKYESIIGLEIHIQQNTKSKMFCACDNDAENKEPNTTVCPICMGHPGTLPVPNKKAIENVILLGLGLHCEIAKKFNFERKNYFYPDLPKGYQITSSSNPPCVGGKLEFPSPDPSNMKTIKLHHIHLEEDAGKLIHDRGDYSLVDLNRACTPLIEIVTEATPLNPLEAKTFLQELQLVVRFLGISNADMEKGHLRCDANISLRPIGDTKLYNKIEIKNLNSFKSVERALEYEIKRQTELWDKKTPPQISETRGWDDSKQKTTEQRSKEEAHDYRYFPEPDIPPIEINKDWLQEIQLRKRELPIPKSLRFIKQYGFNYSEVKVLCDDRDLAYFTENVISEFLSWVESLLGLSEEDNLWEKNQDKCSRLVAGWLINKFGGLLQETKLTIKETKITPENFAELLCLIYTNKISATAALEILKEMIKSPQSPAQIMKDKDFGQVSSAGEINELIEKVITANPKAVAEYKSGKAAALQFLIGQGMAISRGKSNPQILRELLEKKLK